MITRADRTKKIAEDIQILEAGYLSEMINIKSSFECIRSYLLIVSRSNRTLLRVDKMPVNLFENQMIIYSFQNIRQSKSVRGGGVFIHFSGMLAESYIQNDMLNKIIPFNLNDSINKSIRELEANLDNNRPLEPIITSKIGFSILIDLWMHRKTIKQIPRPILNAVKIIENEYGFLFGVEDLADKVGVNKSYLIRLFKEYLNITPGQYLEKHRIDKAKALLSSGDFNVDMVAKFCGYSSANYFGKVFKKNTGVSPSHYLQLDIEGFELEIPPECYI